MLLWMEGAQINFDEDGKLVSIVDATAIQFITEKLSAEQDTGPVPLHLRRRCRRGRQLLTWKE